MLVLSEYTWHADLCPPSKAPTMGMQASELDYGAMEEGGPVWWITFFFTSLGWQGACVSYRGNPMLYGKKATQHRQCDVLFCLEALVSAIYVAVTLTCTTYLRIAGDHVHPFMETIFPDCSGFFQLRQSNNGSGMVWGARQQVWGVDSTSKFPRYESNCVSVRCAGQTSLVTMEATTPWLLKRICC